MGVKKDKSKRDIVVSAAQTELVQRYGEGASQIIQAYSGKRYDSAGNELSFEGRSLKQISNYSQGNGDAAQQQKVVKSQAGFSAELIEEARENKEAILKGDKTRVRTTDGLGMTNDPVDDLVRVDENGVIIPGSGMQMKFYGIDGKGRYKVIENIVKNDKWKKYSDRPIGMPEEQYEGAVKYANEQAEALRKQALELKKRGKLVEASNKRKLAESYEKAGKQVVKSKAATAEAIEARLNPEKFVVKEIAKDANTAGIAAAKGAFVISGSMSIGQNIYKVAVGEKTPEEAVKDVADTTAKSGIVAYGMGAVGTALKTAMHSSENDVIRKLGTTSFPTMAAAAVVETGKSLTQYAKGEIDEIELLEQLGEKGTGIIASSYAATVGAAFGGTIGSAVPIVGTAAGTVVGGFVGSMVGYTASSVLYEGTLEAFKCEKISRERREVIEEISKQAKAENERYCKLLVECSKKGTAARNKEFGGYLNMAAKGILENNPDKFIYSINKVGSLFNIKSKVNSYD
ncbi:MAG: hypothetical protein LUD81_03565, partial [Clostridiales bacterium]|nr:hypothetical protein [Clostridiales bacterium]